MMSGSVAVVDMVGYSDVAKLLEQNISAGSVAELNRQIQGLIHEALANSPVTTDYCFVARTGDGAILFFNQTDEAHFFARSLHLQSMQHNLLRTEASAKRWFRIGIATGPVSHSSCQDRSDEYAGVTIANAVRLEASAKAGEIVIDSRSFDALSPELRPLYGQEEAISGKRAERFVVRKFRVVDPDVEALKKSPSWVTRRYFVGMVASAATVTAGSYALIKYPDWRYPLPDKRFVALMAWPKAEKENQPVVAALLNTIGNHLTRAESYTPNLLILTETDLAAQSNSPASAPSDRQPTEIADLMGATLILATHALAVDELLVITLKVLEATTSRVLRHKQLKVKAEAIAALSDVACATAARMLQLTIKEYSVADEEELRRVPRQVYQSFVEAQRLLNEPNDSGLDQSIAAFQDILALSPKFAFAYGQLALAYLRKYRLYSDEAALALASNNAKRATDLNPDSVSGLLAQSEVSANNGKTSEALAFIGKALKFDPLNSAALLQQARVYADAGDVGKQEAVYRQIIKQRPFYWRAYNDLGVLLKSEAKYKLAEQAFDQASELAPSASKPLANLGMTFLVEGNDQAAEARFRKALTKSPDEIALIGLGDLAFAKRSYNDALDLYRRASEINPKNASAFRDMGDCFEMMSDMNGVKASYKQAADIVFEKLQRNPKPGPSWSLLAFYDAKSGDRNRALQDLAAADQRNANDVDSDLYKAQALAILGKSEEAFQLVLECIDRGLSPVDVSSALDLVRFTSDPRYKAHVAKRQSVLRTGSL
jgi:tetratricopeptide (TPR) repeat protein/class 3 adenylate cyclase